MSFIEHVFSCHKWFHSVKHAVTVSSSIGASEGKCSYHSINTLNSSPAQKPQTTQKDERICMLVCKIYFIILIIALLSCELVQFNYTWWDSEL